MSKNYFNRLFSLVILSTFILCACDDNEESIPSGKYENGVLIVNSGIFGQQSGDFTYMNDSTLVEKVFELENNFVPGGFIQSVTQKDNSILCAINVQGNINGKIQIIDRNTMASIATVEGDNIFAPRFIKVQGEKAYFTDLGEDAYGEAPGTASLTILNLNDYSIEKRIKLPRLPADLAIVDNKAYVAIDGFFDNSTFMSVSDSTIQVIDLNTEEIINKIVVDKNPYGIAKDSEDNLWVLCAEGSIKKINTKTQSVDDSIAAPGIGFDVKYTFNDDRSKLYFIASTWKPGENPDDDWVNVTAINALDLSSKTITTLDVPSASASGVGYQNGVLYLSESAGGTVSMYDESLNKIKSITSGDFPSQFLFAK